MAEANRHDLYDAGYAAGFQAAYDDMRERIPEIERRLGKIVRAVADNRCQCGHAMHSGLCRSQPGFPENGCDCPGGKKP